MADNNNPFDGINTIAAIAPAEGDLLIWDGSDSWDNKPMSGDATIDKDGVIHVVNTTNIQGHIIGGTDSADIVTIGDTQALVNKSVNGISDFASVDNVQTLTNKTLTAPIISTISNTGTLTLPTSTDTLIGRATTDTFTNKTLTSPKINEDVAVTATATEINNGLTPIGTIIMGGMINTPTNYLYCDGSAISRTTYSGLYGVVTLSKGNCTISQASPGVVTLNSHGLLDGDCFELTTTGGLPTGLSVNTNYYVYKNDANSFWVCPTYADAIAHTNRINTSSAGSGTHTLRYCPYGISTSANFLLPNLQAVVPKGVGTQTINTRSKTAPAMGQVEEDQVQGFKLNVGTDWALTASPGAGAAIYSRGGGATTVYAVSPQDDGTNGTPRIGATTRVNSIGVKYYIKYQ